MNAKIREHERVNAAGTTTHRVPCPGEAHRSGGPCLVCDADSDGTIEVFLTSVECDAVASAAYGREVDDVLVARLLKLGLVEQIGGRCVPTPAGYAALDRAHPLSIN